MNYVHPLVVKLKFSKILKNNWEKSWWAPYSLGQNSLFSKLLWLEFISAAATVQPLSRVRLFATPWTVATRLLCPQDSPGKNIGVGCYALLQGIFPTQGLNPGLLYCRQILYHWPTREVQIHFYLMLLAVFSKQANSFAVLKVDSE